MTTRPSPTRPTTTAEPSTFQAKKVQRLRSLLEPNGLDALVLAKNENTRYLTGYQRYWCATYLPFVHCAVITKDAGPFLMLPAHILNFGYGLLPQTDVRLFPQLLPDQVAALAALLEEAGVANGRIGYEADYQYAGFVHAMERALPAATLVDGQPLVDAALSIKLPEEIALMERAGQIVDIGMNAMMEAVRPGMTELQLAAVAGVMLEEGAEFLHHVCCRTGDNAYLLNPVNTDRVIGAGDAVQIDLGCVYQGYVADINRTLYVGGPDPLQADVIRAVSRLTGDAIAALRPGVRASDVYRLVVDTADELGFGHAFNMPFVGHSIGLSLHENPYIEPKNDNVLQEGMVIAMEPGLYLPGQATCRLEDIAVVTADGPRVITHARSDLSLNGLA